MRKRLGMVCAAALAAAALAAPASAQSVTNFTYQGKLKLSGAPVNGDVDLEFRLFSQSSGGAQIGTTQAYNGISVADGLFTRTLNFGAGAFNGESRWLEVAVRSPSGTGNFVILTPRQAVTSVPYAMKVPGLDGHSLDASDGSPTDALYVNNEGNVGIGTITPQGRLDVRSGNNSYWRIDSENGDLHGNGGTDAVLGIYNDSTGAGARTEIILNNQPHLVVNKLGGVGIGTTAPPRRLSVVDGGIFTARFENSHALGSVVEFRNSPSDATWELGIAGTEPPFGSPPGSMYFFKQNELDVAMTLAPNAWVGLGVNNPGYRLDLPNIASADGRGRANRWDTYSSERWKENIRTLDGALDKVMGLRGVSFDWKASHGGGHDVGFIAEEVGRVVPELVTWEADGVSAQGLAYDRVTALTVEAIKDQQGQIEALRRDNAELRAMVAALLGRVEAAEQAK